MKKTRKNEAKTDIDLFNYLTNNKIYSEGWETKKTTNKFIQQILDVSSKADTGKRGEPDLIYVNEAKKLLILIENKHSIKDHESVVQGTLKVPCTTDESNLKDKPKQYAVDGICHYLKFFNGEKGLIKNSIQNYLLGWSIIGIGFSGDINDQYNHLVSTFIISEKKIIDIEVKEILNEEDYLSFFKNIDLESITKNISKSSSEINRKLRFIDSQRRPILLSALMICLYDKGNIQNNFKSDYSRWTTQNIIRNIPTTIEDILKNEGITRDKIDVLVNELAFINTQRDLNNSDILKSILSELEDNVIPLFNHKTNYDIIGKFYEEFLRYAGIANVKKGIVLTPSHITELFAELISIRTNDVILDTCCGTGAFLITGMNKIISEIQNSSFANKTEKIGEVKNRQLIGFEKSSTMYSLAISNMLFRGDGKSRIYNIDTFSDDSEEIIASLKREGILPSIGFINPPYGGSDNAKNPTKKEIQFLEKLLDTVSRYGIMIAPVSTFFKDNIIRNRILSKHTLKYVINMPGELFQPNAATNTAIAVFETHLPHNNKKVIFYDLKDDGYVLSKNRGRTDVFNKWANIKEDLLTKLSSPSTHEDGIHLVNKTIKDNDEWIIQAHSETDYSIISQKSFEKAIVQFIIFTIKMKLGILEKILDEFSLLELFNKYINTPQKQHTVRNKIPLEIDRWKTYTYDELFEIKKGKRLTKANIKDGQTPFIGATEFNNGYRQFIKSPPIHTGNTITVNYNGSVGKSFYQPNPFWASDDVNVLYPKFELNKYVALFIIPLIEVERFRFSFGRKWNSDRMKISKIKLPINKEGKPDWKFMENYIKSLPYADSL